jgi:hypothetical protein
MDSTEEYVTGAFRSREDDISAMFAAEKASREVEDGDPTEVMEELPLSVELKRHVEILLSTGGPAEWIDAELYADGSIASAEFVVVWGSDRRVTVLRDSDALWRFAERFTDLYGPE